MRAEERKVEQRARREREKVGNVSNMTREVMMQEISALEEELGKCFCNQRGVLNNLCSNMPLCTYIKLSIEELVLKREVFTVQWQHPRQQ